MVNSYELHRAARMNAPFPWFGGKRRVAEMVWERFGPVPNYVEPFAGSLAVLLGRPHPPGIETVNDLDCYVANFWRSVHHDPQAVAHWADWPVNEADVHARHLWLVNQQAFRERMKTDPNFYSSKIAGWWVWGICLWIGSGWCSRPEWSGRINGARAERGIHAGGMESKRPDIHHGRGLAADSTGKKMKQKFGDQRRPHLSSAGNGFNTVRVHRSIPDISGEGGAAGRGLHASGSETGILQWMEALARRLRKVRVCCGDWRRVLGRSPTEYIGLTGILLDPPYSGLARRKKDIYSCDSEKVAHDVRRWAVEHGENELLRIAVCGYENEHEFPPGWTCVAWKANGGHGNRSQGNGRSNADRERIWFSPHCLVPQAELFPK